eukprot:536055-Rhodomonas_salina.3
MSGTTSAYCATPRAVPTWRMVLPGRRAAYNLRMRPRLALYLWHRLRVLLRYGTALPPSYASPSTAVWAVLCTATDPQYTEPADARCTLPERVGLVQVLVVPASTPGTVLLLVLGNRGCILDRIRSPLGDFGCYARATACPVLKRRIALPGGADHGRGLRRARGHHHTQECPPFPAALLLFSGSMLSLWVTSLCFLAALRPVFGCNASIFGRIPSIRTLAERPRVQNGLGASRMVVPGA